MGIPERESSMFLQSTQGKSPYSLFATDEGSESSHYFNSTKPLYGVIPYVTGFKADMSSSVTWVNSAHSWLDIAPQEDTSNIATFVSETGMMEFFVFASTTSGNSLNHVKKVQ